MTGEKFNPGPGWRQVDENGYVAAAGKERLFIEHGGAGRFWVYEEPLPTEPYTVIRVVWDPKQTGYAGRVLVRLPEGSYHDWSFGGDEGDGFGSTEHLRREIVSFEVLAEPRAVTAKAVLDRLTQEFLYRDPGDRSVIDGIGREFGVTE